jgi:hypothetical protein
MRNLARRLIAMEQRPKDSTDSEGRAAFRVCDKLRESLSALVGVRGFRTLLARALMLAKVEVPWLNSFELGADGSFIIPSALENEMGLGEAARGGGALVAQLLKLLATLIGEALTLRLVQQIWPKIALDDPKSGGKA